MAPGADRSFSHDHGDHQVKTGFPGLFDDGSQDVTDDSSRRDGMRRAGGDADAIDFAGGIARFTLGGER